MKIFLKFSHCLLGVIFLGQSAIAGPYDINMLNVNPFGSADDTAIRLPAAEVRTNLSAHPISPQGSDAAVQKMREQAKKYSFTPPQLFAPEEQPPMARAAMIPYSSREQQGNRAAGNPASCSQTNDISIMLSPKCLSEMEKTAFGRDMTGPVKQESEPTIPEDVRQEALPPVAQDKTITSKAQSGIICEASVRSASQGKAIQRVSTYDTTKSCIASSIKLITNNSQNEIIKIIFPDGDRKDLKCFMKDEKKTCSIL